LTSLSENKKTIIAVSFSKNLKKIKNCADKFSKKPKIRENVMLNLLKIENINKCADIIPKKIEKP